MKKIQSQIQAAISIARDNPNKFRLAAVGLDKKGRIISTGINQKFQTHPVQKKIAQRNGKPHSEYLHAEMSCILRSRQKIHTLIVVRLYADGELAMAKPCKICSWMIDKYKIPNLVYSNQYSKMTWEKR